MSMSAEFLLPVFAALLASALTLFCAFNWRGGKFLCDDCKYNSEDDCKKSQRPQAVICKAYAKAEKPKSKPEPSA